MKVLSIIGMVFSLFGIYMSLVVLALKGLDRYNTNTGEIIGFIFIIINLFFLAFSITATVVSFRKKSHK